MNRIEKLKNDVYSFEELDTLEKNATKLGDEETLGLIALSRASKTAKGEKVFKFSKNPCSRSTGMGVQVRQESAFSLGENTHL